MIKFKGHSILRQYVKGKPIQWCFKLWCRCDSKTGYLHECVLYLGKNTGMVEHVLGEAVVLKLTEKIEHISCQVYVDNFFNSPSLQVILLQKGIYCAGTVKTNRKLLPKKDVTADKDMKREVASYEASGITYVKWMDNKSVHMLSNFLSAHPLHEVKRRKKGSKKHEKVCFPNVVKRYNTYMDGVDLMDQKKVTYQFKHCSKFKYYLRVVFDMFDIAIVNSYIIYSKLASS